MKDYPIWKYRDELIAYLEKSKTNWRFTDIKVLNEKSVSFLMKSHKLSRKEAEDIYYKRLPLIGGLFSPYVREGLWRFRNIKSALIFSCTFGIILFLALFQNIMHGEIKAIAFWLFFTSVPLLAWLMWQKFK